MAQTPRTAASLLGARRSTFAISILPRKPSMWLFGLRAAKARPAAVHTTAKSARRVSFGGYEVR